MKRNLTLAVALLAAGSAFAAEPGPTDKVKDAITKLRAVTNYSWTTRLDMPGMGFTPEPVKGKTEKGGLAMVTQDWNENTMQVVFKGDKVAVKSEEQWQMIDKVEGPAAMFGGWLARYGTAADEAEDLLKKIKELKPGEGGLFSGDLTDEGAKDSLAYRPRGGQPAPPPPKNAKGSARFWLKDGALTKFESNLKGLVSFSPDQEERDFEVTRTSEISDIGTTKVEVPADAKKLFEAK